MSSRREFLTQSAAGLVAASSPFGQAAQSAAQSKANSPRTAMKTYRIPQTDLVVSRLSYGCAMLGLDWNSADFIERTVPMIHTAYEQGITYFDLANVYGHGKAETALGEVLKQRPGLRDRIVIQSKCGDRFADGKGTSSVDNSREYILSSAEGSLRRLGTDRLDVLLLHWPDSLVEPAGVAQAFDQLHRSGKVRYFGVSNHSPDQIEILKTQVRQPLVINQIQLGLGHWFVAPDPYKARYHHGAEGAAVLDYCRAHDIQVQAWSPLRVTGVDRTSINVLKPAAEASPEVKQAAQLLTDVARKYEVTPAAVMLAWLLRHPAGIVPVFGALKAEHIVENCAADRVDLTHDEWYFLLHAAAAIGLPRPA